VPRTIDPAALEEARDRLARGERLAVVAVEVGISERQLRTRLGSLKKLRGEDRDPGPEDPAMIRARAFDQALSATLFLVPRRSATGTVRDSIGRLTQEQLHRVLAGLYLGLDLSTASAIAGANWNLVTDIWTRGNRELATKATPTEVGKIAIAMVAAQGMAHVDALASLDSADPRVQKMLFDVLAEARLSVDVSGPTPGSQAAQAMLGQLDEAG
jgi:hypothetical protein